MVDGGRVGTAWEGHGQAGDQLSAAELFSNPSFPRQQIVPTNFPLTTTSVSSCLLLAST